jgi:hypothetical protein
MAMQRKSKWQPPPDSDLPAIPLVLGVALAVLAIIAAFVWLGRVRMVVLIAVLLIALGISYRVVMSSESDD